MNKPPIITKPVEIGVRDLPYRQEHPDTLALYCSDGRFTRAVEELCCANGADRIDTITIPGGPGLLDIGKLALTDRRTISRALQFLVRGHSIKTVVLVAHAGCGFYRNQYPRKSSSEIEAVQRADLVAARDCIAGEHRVAVLCYYAQTSEGHIQFYSVD